MYLVGDYSTIPIDLSEYKIGIKRCRQGGGSWGKNVGVEGGAFCGCLKERRGADIVERISLYLAGRIEG